MISEQDRLHFEEGYAAVAMISVETVQARRRGGSYNETGTLVAYFWYCRGLKLHSLKSQQRSPHVSRWSHCQA